MTLLSRRAWLAALGMAAAPSSAGCADVLAPEDEPVPSTAHPDGWPVSNYDVANTRHVPHDGPTDDVQRRWRFEHDDIIGDDLPLIAIADGTAYIGTSEAEIHAIDTGDGEGELLIDLDSSDERTLEAPILGITIFEDHLYVVSDGLYAISRDDGAEEWHVWVVEEEAHLPGIDGPALPVGDHVYVGGFGVYAIDRELGEVAWHFETDDLPPTFGAHDGNLGPFVIETPAVGEGTVYATTFDPILYAIDADTGEERWRYETEDAGFGTPVIRDDIVLLPVHDRLLAFDAERGDEEWSVTFDDAIISPIAVTDEAVFLFRGDALLSYEIGTGDERANVDLEPHGIDRSVTRIRPVVTDEVIYTLGRFGEHLFAFSTVDHELLWDHEIEVDKRFGVGSIVLEGSVLHHMRAGSLSAYADH